jgi:hypothetical protein
MISVTTIATMPRATMYDSSFNHMRAVVNTHIAGQDRLRVADIGSDLFLIAPSKGPEHQFSVDYWRFYPGGYRVLAKWRMYM